MSSKADRERERQKALSEKCVVILDELLRDEDNKYCVDCDAKGPRWASWNLGVFLCIRCAGIHRNLGVHLTRVRSVNLDSWTPDQVAPLQQMGNSKGRAVYEARLPDGFRRPQSDSALEAFIRAKYEHKKYIAQEWVPPKSPPKAAWAQEILSTSSNSSPTSLKKTSKSEDTPKIKPVVQVQPKKKMEPAKQQPSIPKSQSLIDDLLSLDIPPVQVTPPLTNLSSGVNALDLFSSVNPSTQTVVGVGSNSDHFDGLTSLPSLPTSTSASPLPAIGNQPPAVPKMSKESILALYQTVPAAPSFPPQGLPGFLSGAFPAPSPVQPTAPAAPAFGGMSPMANGFPPQPPAYSQSLIDQMKKLGMQAPSPMAPAMAMAPNAPIMTQTTPTRPGFNVGQPFAQTSPGFVNPWDMQRPSGPSSLPSPQGMSLGAPSLPASNQAYGQTMSKNLWQ